MDFWGYFPGVAAIQTRSTKPVFNYKARLEVTIIPKTLTEFSVIIWAAVIIRALLCSVLVLAERLAVALFLAQKVTEDTARGCDASGQP